MIRRAPKSGSHLKFDPSMSLAFGGSLLSGIGTPHALIGRIAMWYWLDESAHEFTKDVDFAVPTPHMPRVLVAVRQTKAEIRQLPIGGFNARIAEQLVNVDFIDRADETWGNLQPLYFAAVLEARSREDRVDGVPVASPEYLAAMKIGAGTDKDTRDAVSLLARVEDIDVQEVRRLAREYLGPAAIGHLEEALRRAGHPAARRAYSGS